MPSHRLPNEFFIVEYLGGFPFGASYKYHFHARFWYMHLFLYFGVFHLDRVPEVEVQGIVAHVGWLGSKSVSSVWMSVRWRMG